MVLIVVAVEVMNVLVSKAFLKAAYQESFQWLMKRNNNTIII